MAGYAFVDLLFSLIAAAVAFGITYNEYVHHYPTKKEPIRLALSTAIFTFITFLALGAMGILALHWMS